MKLERLSCADCHDEWFVELAGQALSIVAERLSKMRCPFCQSENVNIHAGSLDIVGHEEH